MLSLRTSFLAIVVLLTPSMLYCRVKHKSMRSLMSSICVNIALVVFLFSLEKIYGMQKQQSAEAKQYIIGMQILNCTDTCIDANPLNTIVYLDYVFDEEKLEKARSLVAKIDQGHLFPLTFGAESNRGIQEHSVPVRILYHKYFLDAVYFRDLLDELRECKSDQPEKLKWPKYYVSLNDPKIREEFKSREKVISYTLNDELVSMTSGEVVGGKVFIKSLENFDLLFE